MENKENNNLEQQIVDIDSKKRIDMFACPDGIKSISLTKKIALFLTGLFGLMIISVFVVLLFTFAPMSAVEKNAAVDFVVYAILFVVLLGILNVDILKLKVDFSRWKNWLIGAGIGIGLIIVPIAYTTFVSLFYQYQISENESSLREIIKIYPVASVFILAIVGPICEELTYRVGLFGTFEKKKWLAYLIAIVIFALVHFSFDSKNIVDEFVNLPIYLFSGAALAFAYDKFGLSGSLAAHIVNNMYAVIMSIIANSL